MRTGTIVAAALAAGVVALVASSRKTPTETPEPVGEGEGGEGGREVPDGPPGGGTLPPDEARINDDVDVMPAAIPAELATPLLAAHGAGARLTGATVHILARNTDTGEFGGVVTGYAWTNGAGATGTAAVTDPNAVVFFHPAMISLVRRAGANPNQALIDQGRDLLISASGETNTTITPERLALIYEVAEKLRLVEESRLAAALLEQADRLSIPTPVVQQFATCRRPANEANRSCPLFPTPARSQANPPRLPPDTLVQVLEKRPDGWWLVQTVPGVVPRLSGWVWHLDMAV